MLRKMQVEDIEAVAALDSECFPLPWQEEQYRYELHENPFAHVYVLEVDDRIIGYIDFWITCETCQLAKIAVAPAYRGQQYAHLLMDVMIATANQEQCETISLEVRVSNEAAHKLYEHYDFIKVNVRKAYYQDNGEDADFLIKALGGNCI